MMRRRWLAVAVVLTAGLATALSGCGPPAPSARAVLSAYLTAWGRGDWAAMQRLAAGAPAGFVPVNAAVFRALGVTHASFTAGPTITASSGKTASARVTEHFDLPQAGAWNPVTTVHLANRNGAWRVVWSPATINPSLGAGDTLAVTRAWPPRAPVLGGRRAADPDGQPCRGRRRRQPHCPYEGRSRGPAGCWRDPRGGEPRAGAGPGSPGLLRAGIQCFTLPVRPAQGCAGARQRVPGARDRVPAHGWPGGDHCPAWRSRDRLAGPGHRRAAASPWRAVRRNSHRRADRAGGIAGARAGLHTATRVDVRNAAETRSGAWPHSGHPGTAVRTSLIRACSGPPKRRSPAQRTGT